MTLIEHLAELRMRLIRSILAITVGAVLVFAFYDPVLTFLKRPYEDVCRTQKNLQGSIFGHGNPQHDIPMLLSLYQAGKLNLDDMVTREYRLEEINDGYLDMFDGRNIRGIIRFTDADR